jgi:Lrp/AsnC family transcriptional regulator
MAVALDELDRKILIELQRDATIALDKLSQKVGSSKTPVWNRIKKMREQGVIERQVAVVSPEAIGLETCFFVFVRTSEHNCAWLNQFLKAVLTIPQIIEAHRLAGDIDYILKVRVENAAEYDEFYQELISKVKIFNVTSTLSLEEIKATTVLPVKLKPVKE